MTGPALNIRVLTLHEVEVLLGWAASEGWNPGLDDAEPFQAADPDGFLGGFVDGELVAGISAVRYGSGFGFIGLYICRPDMRGKGYGRQVWDAGMQHLEGRIVGLDGVPEQQENYGRMGFHAAYRTWRWSGILPAGSFPAGKAVIVSVDGNLLAQLMEFDQRYFPSDREAFLASWLQAPRMARAALLDGEVVGYGVARACGDGFKVGPLFARDQQIALAILENLAGACGGATVHIDVPDTAGAFADALAALGMSRGFVTARMYRGGQPVLRQKGVYAVTTLELG